jgi:cell division protein FtsB
METLQLIIDALNLRITELEAEIKKLKYENDFLNTALGRRFTLTVHDE